MKKLLLPAFLCSSIFSNAQNFNLQVLDAGPFNYVTPGVYPVYITAKNLNINYLLTTLQAHWQLDGGTIHSCAINDFMVFEGIYPLFTERFTHDDSVSLTTAGSYQLKVWTSMPGSHPDTDPSNDTATLTINVTDSLPDKNVIMLYGTHTECFPCGTYGEPELDEVLDSFPETVLALSVHDGLNDPYMNEDGIHLNNVYIWPYTGHPAFIFDFFTYPYFSNVLPDNNYVYGEMWKAVPLRTDYRYPIEVSIKNLMMDTFTHVLNGEVHAKFYADFSGALAFNAIIAEDSIYGHQDGIPYDIYHRFVLRDMTEGLYGITGIIPENVSAGAEYVYAFSETLPTDFNEKNIYVTGYVQYASEDSMKCDILNAGRERLTDFGAVTSVTQVVERNWTAVAFPNPVEDILTIQFTGVVSEEVVAELYDVTGRKLYINFEMNLRNNIAQFPLKNFPAGYYVLQLRSDAQVKMLNVIRL